MVLLRGAEPIDVALALAIYPIYSVVHLSVRALSCRIHEPEAREAGLLQRGWAEVCSAQPKGFGRQAQRAGWGGERVSRSQGAHEAEAKLGTRFAVVETERCSLCCSTVQPRAGYMSGSAAPPLQAKSHCRTEATEHERALIVAQSSGHPFAEGKRPGTGHTLSFPSAFETAQ